MSALERKGFQQTHVEKVGEYDFENPPMCNCGWNPLPCIKIDEETWLCIECDAEYSEN